MTTLVTVKANGPCYPARVVLKDATGGEVQNQLIGSGFSYELWVGPNQTITVSEEYHAAGYPLPAKVEPDAAVAA